MYLETSDRTLLLVTARFGQNEYLEFLFFEGLAGNVEKQTSKQQNSVARRTEQ